MCFCFRRTISQSLSVSAGASSSNPDHSDQVTTTFAQSTAWTCTAAETQPLAPAPVSPENEHYEPRELPADNKMEFKDSNRYWFPQLSQVEPKSQDRNSPSLVEQHVVTVTMEWMKTSQNESFDLPSVIAQMIATFLDDSIFIDTVMLDYKEKSLLIAMMEDSALKNERHNQQLELKLLYRMSRDGKSLESARKHYYKRGPTVIIMQSDFNHICGGYTSQSWQSSLGPNEGYMHCRTKDEDAFVFLLRSQFGHTPAVFRPKDVHRAIYHGACGPRWGSDGAICIWQTDEFHAYSDTGDRVYQVTGNSLLGGETYETAEDTYCYWLNDYEVFQVNATAIE